MPPATLETYLSDRQGDGTPVPAGLATLIRSVADACKTISAMVAQGAAGGVLGALEQENVQGEVQKKLDVLANDVLLATSESCGVLAGAASEEMEQLHPVPGGAGAPYLLLFDPLDGSSNIDVNVSIGTIFSVLPAPDHGGELQVGDFLQPGSRQVAAGYAVYGPQTSLVLTLGQGVVGFTLDPAAGVWLLTEPALQMPEKTKEFSINMSNLRHWAPAIRGYIDDCLAGSDGPRGKNYNMRWVGSMVADVHRILSRGGIFLYPWDAREPNKPGKLRLMYEANPMALLAEQAGGLAIDGPTRILDIQPTGLHQRVAVMLGSRDEVERLAAAHAPGG